MQLNKIIYVVIQNVAHHLHKNLQRYLRVIVKGHRINTQRRFFEGEDLLRPQMCAIIANSAANDTQLLLFLIFRCRCTRLLFIRVDRTTNFYFGIANFYVPLRNSVGICSYDSCRSLKEK